MLTVAEMEVSVVVADNNRKNGETLICPVCGKEFYRKKYLIEHAKDKNNMTCSRKCCYTLRKTLYKGEGNHQYGLKGELNASWKDGTRDYPNHYKMVTDISHPFRNEYNLIPVYVLVAEKYLLTDENSVDINGNKYLNPKCVVHHKDFDKKNDNPENLYIFDDTSKHVLYHNIYPTKHFSVEEFEEYYKDKYIDKILNDDWLYRAYVEFDLSVNQISSYFDIPYKSIASQVEKLNLKPLKQDIQSQRIAKIIEVLNDKSERENGIIGSSGK